MSAEPPFLTRTFAVGRFKCTMIVRRPVAGKMHYVATEWWPWKPLSLSKKHLRQYMRGRVSVLAEAREMAGLEMVAIDTVWSGEKGTLDVCV